MNKTNPVSQYPALAGSNTIFTSRQPIDAIRNINKGGLSNTIPKIKRFQFSVAIPLIVSATPNFTYLNQVLIHLARWFTNCSDLAVFSSYTIASGANAM